MVPALLRFKAYCDSTYVIPSSTQFAGRLKELVETSKDFRGTFYSPFMRAEAGKSMDDFLPIVDGFTEAFIANLSSRQPWYSSSCTICWYRAELFGPRGLHCVILSTKDIMTKTGAQNLDDLDKIDARRVAQLHEEHGGYALASRMMPVEPRLQRLRPLEGFVAPLQIDSLPDRVGAKQVKELCKKRHRGGKKRQVKSKDAEKEQRYYGKEFAKIEKELDLQMRELQHEMEKICRERDKKVVEKWEEGDGKTNYKETPVGGDCEAAGDR
ncbi:hypothetical protein BO78DRAFT_470904 [Aspergillus sclerotiicarbonarius CBS 121057]|uniref:Uncharacterized protein n=1 Tax=Aspergillus sclerotiicarbonarius (strain CBS 121057 / IBT 28362) TaxID=1448318 RepID=A0A319EMM9_ASPSB|nr:hypothetical protein BO78DRAFT_470904 [Aspergillus sclerotiicarbonarius CBS 121057]